MPDIYLLKPFLFLGGFSHPLSLKPIPSENGVLVNGALVFEAFQYCFLTRRWFVHRGEHVKHLFSLVLVSKGNGCFMHLPVVWGGGGKKCSCLGMLSQRPELGFLLLSKGTKKTWVLIVFPPLPTPPNLTSADSWDQLNSICKASPLQFFSYNFFKAIKLCIFCTIIWRWEMVLVFIFKMQQLDNFIEKAHNH